MTETAGLVVLVAGLLKPAPAAWNWLDAPESERWRALWEGWLADLSRSPREPALWARFRMPTERPFVCTVLDILSTLPDGGWWELMEFASRLRGRCIGAGTLPRNGDVLAPLQALLTGPLTWAALVRTDPAGNFSLTSPGDWLMGRPAEPPQSPPPQPATINCLDDDHLVVTLPVSPDRPPLRPLVVLPLTPKDRQTRYLTRERFVAALAHGLARAWIVQMLAELAGGPPPPAALFALTSGRRSHPTTWLWTRPVWSGYCARCAVAAIPRRSCEAKSFHRLTQLLKTATGSGNGKSSLPALKVVGEVNRILK